MDVLLHFCDMPKEDLSKFGILGFERLNGRDNSKKAFMRTHVFSTVLLNLNKLQNVEYHWRAHLWEDLQFNRDAEKSGAVLCKCYRFAFSSPQIKKGGCYHIVARDDEKTAPAPASAPDLASDPVPASSFGAGPAGASGYVFFQLRSSNPNRQDDPNHLLPAFCVLQHKKQKKKTHVRQENCSLTPNLHSFLQDGVIGKQLERIFSTSQHLRLSCREVREIS